MKQDHDDFAFEPVRGLPSRLPPGERLIWQGAPDWRLLAIEAFHWRKVAIYFALVGAWQLASAMAGGAGVLGAATGLWALGAAALGSLAILAGLAWLYARTTVYSLTTRRLVIRSGLALPVTLSLPLALIENATLAARRDGSGGIAFEVAPPNRVAWLVAWPNTRPWRFNRPQPMFRAMRDARPVAEMVAAALASSAGNTRPSALRMPAPAATSVDLAPEAGLPA